MQTTTIKKLLWFTFYSMPFLHLLCAGSETRPEDCFAPKRQRFFRAVQSRPLRLVIGRNARAVTRAPGDPPELHGGKPTAQDVVKGYVRMEAVEHQVDPQLALWIVKHESHFNPRAKGDGEASRGLWQISKIYHPGSLRRDGLQCGIQHGLEPGTDPIREGLRMVHLPQLQNPLRGLPFLVAQASACGVPLIHACHMRSAKTHRLKPVPLTPLHRQTRGFPSHDAAGNFADVAQIRRVAANSRRWTIGNRPRSKPEAPDPSEFLQVFPPDD